MPLTDAMNTMLNGNIVRAGILVEFGFDSPQYFWVGSRPITTSDGKTWQGIRQLVSISGFDEEDDNLQASDVKVEISGVDESVLQLAVAEDRSLYIGSLLRFWISFFDEDFEPLDDPVAFKTAIIDGIEINHNVTGDGPEVRTLAVNGQNLYYGRNSPPASNYSNSDQQFRSPGDRGFEFVSDAVEEVIPVPW